ncbi:MAG: thymidine kinase [Candidatus Eiseniibacteriota bacterium]|nr:MAG: thymidine kinase [Candidatus Eisenbacteria bacterium]
MSENIVPKNVGWIEVICGSMFSGKTEELIRRLRRAQIAKQKVAIFKPKIDKRYGAEYIVSHNLQRIPSQEINDCREILKKARNADAVGIDEVQFFGLELVDVCQQLADSGKRVIVAGLDQDYTGQPFEPMPQLLAIAEYITKTLAICVVCGNPANRTQRKVASAERIVVGAFDVYEARCRNCFEPPEKERDAPKTGTRRSEASRQNKASRPGKETAGRKTGRKQTPARGR